MTTLARITIGLLIALFSSSCAFDLNFGSGKKGNGIVAEESREITEEFTAVLASEGLDVFVTQASDFTIRVEADENVIDLIATDIENGRLRIHTIEDIGRATKKVYVSLPEINSLEGSGGADLIAQNVIKMDKINLEATSGADLNVELVVDKVDADASSGADIRITGEAATLIADASSGSDIKARNLITKNCTANASSGSDIRVHVTESLVADASSGADISYSGDASVKKNKSSSGSVHYND